MAEFDDLLNDADYKGLAPEQQYQVRRSFLQQKIAADEDFKQLSVEDRQRVTKSVLFPGEKDFKPGVLQQGAASDAVDFGLSALSRLAPLSKTLQGQTSNLTEISQDIVPPAVNELVGGGLEKLRSFPVLGDFLAETAEDAMMALPPVAGSFVGPSKLRRASGETAPVKPSRIPTREGSEAAPFRRLEESVPADDALLLRRSQREAIERGAIERAVAELEPTKEQSKTSSLLDEARKQTSVEPEGNPTLRAAQENALRGKPDVAEPVSVEAFRKQVEAEREAPRLEQERLGKRLEEFTETPKEQPKLVETAKEQTPTYQHQAREIPNVLDDKPMFFTGEGTRGFYGTEEGFKTVKAKVDLKKPFIESKAKPEDFLALEERLRSYGLSEKEVKVRIKEAKNELGAGLDPETTQAFKDLGYDGIVADTSWNTPHTIALYPKKQVKLLREAGEKAPQLPQEARSQATPTVDLSKAGIFDLVKEGYGSEVGSIGKLTPEQQAIETRARAARAELNKRISEKAAATGETFEQAGKSFGLAESVVNRLGRERSIEQAQDKIASTTEQLANLNKKAEQLVTESETIQKTGTISKELREGFREEGKKPQTFGTKFSEKEIFESKAQIVGLAREIKSLHSVIEDAIDPFAKERAKTLQPLLDGAIKKMNDHAANFRRLRFAAGRAVKQFDRAVPEEVIQDLRDAGVILDDLRTAKDRTPILESIKDKATRFTELTSTERNQLGRDLVDFVRLNIFGMFSFSRDILSNVAETGAQFNEGLGRDFVKLAKGDASFPTVQAAFRAARRTKAVEQVYGKANIQSGAVVEQALRERIAGGERFASGFTGEKGVFTSRDGVASTTIDYVVGTPLYLKSVIDTGSKRFAATRSLWEDAITEANKQKLSGLDRQKFYDTFFQNPPSAAIDKAIRQGNKAGFNRDLTKLESRIAGNKFFQLVGEGFARWPFQFTRWAGEMLGANPELFKKVAKGTASLEDIGGYLGKTATGIGGLYLLNEMLYDNVDFNNMSYIHANGERTPLSNLEPITTALFLGALVKGDVDRATAALKYASVPFGRFLLGEGGLIGSFVKQVDTAIQNGDVDSGAVKKEFINQINRMIPGQGVLSAIKAIFDPTNREGFAGNMPGISAFKDPVINRTTGESQQPDRRLFGIESPRIGALSIPGATVTGDPVAKLFNRFGLNVNRGKRQPIAGIPAADIPEGLERQFIERLGKARQRIIGRYAENTLRRLEQNPELLKNQQFMDSARKLIQKLDAQAARVAKQQLDREAGAPSKLPRRPTIRERRGPVSGRPD